MAFERLELIWLWLKLSFFEHTEVPLWGWVCCFCCLSRWVPFDLLLHSWWQFVVQLEVHWASPQGCQSLHFPRTPPASRLWREIHWAQNLGTAHWQSSWHCTGQEMYLTLHTDTGSTLVIKGRSKSINAESIDGDYLYWNIVFYLFLIFYHCKNVSIKAVSDPNSEQVKVQCQKKNQTMN